MKKLYIIGIGMGNIDWITPYAKNIILNSDKVLTTFRASELFENAVCLTLDGIYTQLAENSSADISVLVTGDAGFFSMSKGITEKFNGEYDIEIINGISSLQYFSAKLKIPYDDIVVASMHGRDSHLLGKVSYNKKVFLLTGGENKVHVICKILSNFGLGHVKVYVGENLSYDIEKISCGTATELADMTFSDLAVMIIENDKAADIHKNLRDEDFIRGESPMTKEEVRNLVVASLSIKPTDIVYDVGAGTGSVSVAMARRAYDSEVYAVEKEQKGINSIKLNIEKHGTYNVRPIYGSAPDALLELPAPDAVFIGGSSGNLMDIISLVKSKNANVKIVITSVTLQTITEIMNVKKELAYEVRITCVNVAAAKAVGAYDMMLAQNPVYIAVLE